jgi:pimeloyl-ACP methyl ester carboxylesterase
MTTSAEDQLIIVVHGFAGKRLWMRPLCARLRSQGYRVSNWGYASLRGSIAEHGRRFHEYVAVSLSEERRIHIVAHSMGAIVVRAALAMGPVGNLGRVVLLAPPNHGTPVARNAGRIVGRVCRGIGDLSDGPDSFVNRLRSPPPMDVGVVAAKFDILVPVASTHLDGECQHIVLNATHNSLLLSGRVANLVLAFIAAGRFGRDR